VKSTPGPSSASARLGAHIPELDGIRAVAVWMVLCAHLLYGGPTPKATLNVIPKFVGFVFGHGWLGVDLFFVLSGFLITGILLDSRDKPGYFRNFYARRFLRIIPLYFAVVLVCWPFYPETSKYFLLSLLFLANFAYAFGAAVPHGPGVFWSLAIEEHFYLVWPWLVRYLTRRALTVTAIGLVVVIPVLRFWAVSAGMNPRVQIYNYSFFRFDGLALGALMAIWVRSAWANRRTSLWLSAALVGASVVVTLAGIPFGVLSEASVLRYTQAQLVFAGFLVAVVALKGTGVTAPLRWPFAKLSGDLSYCIYLTHLSISDGYQHLLQKVGIDPLAAFGPLGLLVVRAIAILGCTFGIALLSRRFLERPVLRLKRYFEYGSAHGLRAAVSRQP